MIGAAIGGVSGAVGSWGSALVGGGVLGAGFGGALAGATAGGLNTAIYGGNITEAMMYGAVWGAVGGAAFGAIGSYYGSNWSWERILAQGIAGGALSEAQGGDFGFGFAVSAGSALAMKGWQEMRNRVDASSLASRDNENPKIRYHSLDGELDTIGERRCETNCGGGLDTNLYEGDYSNFESELGRFVNLVSKPHDFSNSWSYNDSGHAIGRGPVFNFFLSLYSYAGMLPAGLYTAFAFSANSYQPIYQR